MSHINYIKCIYDFKYKAFYFHITKYLLNSSDAKKLNICGYNDKADDRNIAAICLSFWAF